MNYYLNSGGKKFAFPLNLAWVFQNYSYLLRTKSLKYGSLSVAYENGGDPANIINNMTPAAKTSTLVPLYGYLLWISGAI
jgi:hypothetical protein